MPCAILDLRYAAHVFEEGGLPAEQIMKKQYASMQEELAARKAAAGYKEEPRARRGSADTDDTTGPLADRLRLKFGDAANTANRARGDRGPAEQKPGTSLRTALIVAMVAILFCAGMVITLERWDYYQWQKQAQSSDFTEESTNEDVVDYVAERWSIDTADKRETIRLLQWSSENRDAIVYEDIGPWELDVSNNMAVIAAEIPDDMSLDDFYDNCKAVDVRLKDLLDEGGLSNPAVVIGRWPNDGELILVMINGGEYFSSFEREGGDD